MWISACGTAVQGIVSILAFILAVWDTVYRRQVDVAEQKRKAEADCIQDRSVEEWDRVRALEANLNEKNDMEERNSATKLALKKENADLRDKLAKTTNELESVTKTLSEFGG